MKVECSDQKTFQLKDNEKLLGQLIYKNLLSYNAEIILTNSDSFEIKTSGISGTSITVSKNEIEIANLKLSWKGNIVMTFQDGKEYVFKCKGTFHRYYIIENTNEEKLIQFKPIFNLGKFRYNFEISYDEKPEDILLVLLGVYASNYSIFELL